MNKRRLSNLFLIIAGALFLSATSIAQVTVKPVVHWKFDEAKGTTASDATGNTGDLSFIPGMNPDSWVEGKIDTALTFDGTTSKLTGPADSLYHDYEDRSFSISFWANFAAGEAPRKAFYYTTGTFLLGQTVLADTGVVKLQVKNNTGSKLTLEVEDSYYYTGQWTLFTFVRDVENQKVQLWANDVLAGEKEYGDAFLNWDFNDAEGLVHVGANSNADPAKFFGTIGDMDDIRIYDLALRQEQIESLHDMTADVLGGYWPLDDGTGATATDISGNMNDAALFNMADTNWVDGKLFGGLEFDGANNYAKVAYDESLEFGDGPFSVSMWVKSAQRGYTGRYMSYGSLILRQADTDDVRFRINVDGAKVELSVPDAKVVTGEWVLVTAVRDTVDGQLKVYANTELLGTLDVPQGNFDNTGDDKAMYIGSNNEAKIAGGKHQGIVGSLDEIRVFAGKALTAEEILKIYSAGNTNYFTLTVEATTNGTIEVSPEGENFPEGSVVQLTAVPAEGYHLVAWGGDASGSETVTTVTMDADKTVSATFAEGLVQYKLKITQDGDGTGIVARSTADTLIDQGTEVTLTAVAFEGSAFGGWTGDIESFETTVIFSMDKDMTVNANFISDGPAYDVLVTYQEVESTDTLGLNYTKDDPPSPLWTNNPGYTGDGFYDFENQAGGEIEWTIKKGDIDGANTYIAIVRYAHGGEGDRPVKVDLNGTEIEASHSFEPTGAWSIWKKEVIEVDLLDADNTIRFTALSDDGMVNMDALQIARNPTGAEEFQIESFNVYPNPTAGMVYIDYAVQASNQEVAISVTDLSGRTIDEVVSTLHMEGSYSVEYNTSHLSSGIYLVNILTSEHANTLKLIVK